MQFDWSSFSNDTAWALLHGDLLDRLLEELGCDLRKLPGGVTYRGPCPVHGGDGRNNFELRTDGDVLPIRWRCYSQNCERKYKGSVLGLVWGVLQFQSGKKTAWDAVQYLQRFLGGKPPVSPGHRLVKRAKPTKPTFPPLTRGQVRQNLVVPADYFLRRGFSQAVLDGHDVGYSAKLDRVVVPLYDDANETCVGFTSRSPYPRCTNCFVYHRPSSPCPPPDKKHHFPKWSNNDGLDLKGHLYNYAAACRSPLPFVVVVEGPGDVWRAEEAGVPAVAVLGNSLSDVQAKKVLALKKAAYYVCFDDDAGGERGRLQAVKKLWDATPAAYPVGVPHGFHDLGEMPVAQVQAWIQRLRKPPPRRVASGGC